MTPRTARPRRAAFTLVELLVVVTIIALLAGLLLVGIQRVARVGATAAATNDISQLNVACETFKKEFGFFPPSAFRLPTNSPTTTTNAAEVALETASFELLKQMYPRWTPVVNAGGVIAWGNLQPFAGQTLDGNQSMVLFLGGPQQTGWATDRPQAPAGAATAVKGPFFDFKQDRLDGNQGGPRHYLDPFKNPTNPAGKPFAYFGSKTPGGKYDTIQCFGVYALCESANKFVNQGGVQIISAGEDGVFGTHPTANQIFTAGSGNIYGEGSPGADDLANFNNGNKLGVGR